MGGVIVINKKKTYISENDSKNTRMDLASAVFLGNWRRDELAHMGRFDKIALCIDEAKRLGRPLNTFEMVVVDVGKLYVVFIRHM